MFLSFVDPSLVRKHLDAQAVDPDGCRPQRGELWRHRSRCARRNPGAAGTSFRRAAAQIDELDAATRAKGSLFSAAAVARALEMPFEQITDASNRFADSKKLKVYRMHLDRLRRCPRR